MAKLLTINTALKNAAGVTSAITLGVIAALAGPVWAAQTAHAANSAKAPTIVPIFSPNSNVGWISYGPDFIPEPSGPQPVTFDPAHPFVENGIEYNAAQPNTKNEDEQSTFPVSGLSDPILQPWAREELRKLNGQVLAGRSLFSRQSSCWPMAFPASYSMW